MKKMKKFSEVGHRRLKREKIVLKVLLNAEKEAAQDHAKQK